MSQGPSLEGERERGDRAEYQMPGFLGLYEGFRPTTIVPAMVETRPSLRRKGPTYEFRIQI